MIVKNGKELIKTLSIARGNITDDLTLTVTLQG